MEELDTEISVGELIDTIEYDYPTFHLSMDCFWCEVIKGNLVLKEAEDAKWLKKNELDKVDWLPADVELIGKNSFREKNLRHEIEEFEMLIWQTSGYCTYEYIALDINKLRFVKRKNHLYVLMQANVTSEKEMRSKVIGKNEIIRVDNCTEELYARYVFWEGDKENLIKVECIANNLPYYVCLIQPKEGVKSTFESKQILLTYTLEEIDKRLKKVGVALKEDIEDRDEIFSKGNTIRNILEYTLKHFCVIRGIEIDIEQKYGHIELGELRKKIKDIPNINIPQSLINTANELSHDSGKKYNIENVREFYGDVCELVKQIKDAIWTEEDDL